MTVWAFAFHAGLSMGDVNPMRESINANVAAQWLFMGLRNYCFTLHEELN
jgi:hypothetical protein